MVGTSASACPPPPPPVPTLEQQAERQWSNAENLCVVTLVPASLMPTRVERGGRWSIAQGHWQVQAIVGATLKGRCGDGTVVFPELSPAMCGLGMAPLGTPLLAAVDNDASLSWWAPSDAPLAFAVLRGLKSVWLCSRSSMYERAGYVSSLPWPMRAT